MNHEGYSKSFKEIDTDQKLEYFILDLFYNIYHLHPSIHANIYTQILTSKIEHLIEKCTEPKSSDKLCFSWCYVTDYSVFRTI